MRGFKPELGSNVALLKKFWGRCPMNGSSNVASWTEGGQGLGLPQHAATGKFTITITDPPGGVLLFAHVTPTTTFANLANVIDCRTCDWNSSTNTLTFATCTVGTATAADPPAAAAGYEFHILLVFGQSENH